MSHPTSRWFVFALVALLLIFVSASFAAPSAKMPDQDRLRLAEAFRLADSLDNHLWKGWDQIPFIVLLITPDTEFLVHHPKPDTTFTLAGYDSLLKSNVYTRPRVFPHTLLASFPFDDYPTTVIGEAENTEAKASTAWVCTLMHEHFHQFEYTPKEYYPAVDALNLTGGDRTGMWMLNYPFPYDSSSVQAGFDRMKMALSEAVTAPDSLATVKFAAYGTIRRDFYYHLTAPDHKYMAFQLWQEGMALYTELRVSEWADKNFPPSAAFQALPDYKPFSEHASFLHSIIEKGLPNVKLADMRRVSFYFVGIAEAVLLDRVNPAWRETYFTNMLTLDPYFAK